MQMSEPLTVNIKLISVTTQVKTRAESTDLTPWPFSHTKNEVASLPRLVTPAKVPDMAAQLQGMLGTPLGFVSTKK